MINLFRRLFALKFDTPRATIELMADNHGEKLELLWSRNSSFISRDAESQRSSSEYGGYQILVQKVFEKDLSCDGICKKLKF